MEFKKIRNKDGKIKENISLLPFDITNSENEKDIEFLFKSYIEKVGWINNGNYTRDKDMKNRYNFRNNKKRSTNGKPDYIFYNEDKDIIAICDTKSTSAGIEASLEDGKDYIKCLNEDYNLNIKCVIGFDGVNFAIQYFNGKDWVNVSIESIILEQMPDISFLKFIIESENELELVPETENIDRNLLVNFFKATDEIIRRSSIGSSPTEKFIELSTIIFIKMFSLKEYDKVFIKKESLKYSTIWDAVLAGDVNVINNKFAKWLDESYHNIGLDNTHQLIRIEAEKLIQVAKLVDRIFGTYELTDFTNVKGDILEYFQSTSKDRKIGEFFTPRHLIRYMVKLIEPTVVNKNGDIYIEKIYDPACGTGGFLIEAFNRYKDIYGSELPDLDILKQGVLHGTELKTNTALLAKLNMILIGDGHTNIINTDAFAYDKIEKVSKLKNGFGHYIVISEEQVDYFMEGTEKKYYVKGDRKRKVSYEADGTMDFLYDDFGEKIEVPAGDIIKQNKKLKSSDGFIVKKVKGKYYKQIPVRHYELKDELESNIKYEYKNIQSVNPKLTIKETMANPNPLYQENFGKFDIVLANQPFGLSEPSKADYYFIDHMLKSLHDDKNKYTSRYGRIACIVDNGFLYDSKYLEERKSLQENNTIKAIISLPQKVFAPYVKTIKSNIILIEKRKPRKDERTYFVKIENDGYSQDDKRIKQINNDDFKELMSLWKRWDDIEIRNPETNEIEYESSHKEKEGFAEYHHISPKSWAVNNYIKYNIPKFNYQNVPLAKYISEVGEKIYPVNFTENNTDIVEIKGVSKKYGIITSEVKKASEYNQKYNLLKNNCIAYNPSRVNIGSIALYKGEDALISPSYVVFTVNEDEFLPKYVTYFLKSEYGRKQIENFNNGTVRNSLNYDDLGKIKIPKMSIKEQERLVLLISNATNAKINLFDSYSSLLKLGVPDNSFNKFNYEYEELELGSMIQESSRPSYGCSKKSDDLEDGFPILKMNNIYPIIDESSLADEVDKIGLTDEEYEKYRIYENDILINRTNSIDLVGKTGLFRWKLDDELTKCIFASYLMKITLKEEYSPVYVTYFMNLSATKNEIRKFAVQSNGQYNINLENLKKLKILYPKNKDLIPEFETEFINYCSQLNNLMELVNLMEVEENSLFGRYLFGNKG